MFFQVITTRKIIFSFSRRLEKMVFAKKSCFNMIFLVLSGKMIFLFPEIWSYTLDRKWKMIFLKKINGNMIFSSNFLKKWSLQKEPRRDMIFLALSGGKMVFFSRKHIFSLGRNWGAIFLKKHMEIWHFLYTRTRTNVKDGLIL